MDEYNGDDSWTFPMPTRLIIRHAEINPDYTVRPDPEDTIEALRRLV